MRVIELRVIGMVVGVVLVLSVGVSPAFADSAWWGLSSGSWPSNLPAEGRGEIVVTAQNRGYEKADGSGTPFVLKDTLPAGLQVIMSKGAPEIESVVSEGKSSGRTFGPEPTCSSSSSQEVECDFEDALPPFEQFEIRIAVKVAADASSGEENIVGISGGNAASKTLEHAVSVGDSTEFGVEDYEQIFEEEGGRPSTQAGAHPFQFTTTIGLNTSEAAANAKNQEPAAMAKDLTFQLPAGFIGNPTPFAQCTDVQFTSEDIETSENRCLPQTTIGAATVTYNPGGGVRTTTVPLSNLVPLAGEPARFGFSVAGVNTILDTSLRVGGDYGVTVRVSNLPEIIGFMVSKVTFWGVPGDPLHNNSRTRDCIQELVCAPFVENEPSPLLSLPTSCTGPMRTTVQVDSWAEPKPTDPLEAPLFGEDKIAGLDGCNHLPFDPEISVSPDVPSASTPTGLMVQVHLPQSAALNPKGLAESALRDTTVVLPAGVAVNPGGADGLEACSEGQVGYLGKEVDEPDTNLFTPVVGSPFCSSASKIGTVEIESPLLPRALKGAVYLASQSENPFGSLIAMYIVAEDQVSGTLLKIPGEVTLNQETAQLSSTFKNTPQLPFENLRLHFFGESRAPLGTPALCGSYSTDATFAPWSGNASSLASSTFDITAGPDGSPCPNPPGDQSPRTLPFDPSLTAGTTSIQAGGFSPFTTTMSRPDGNQNLKSVQLHMPSGLLGTISSVKLCEEPQADAGTCGPESLVGHTIVSVGLGGNPYSVTGGQVFITGPYQGAPYGLAIVELAKAGPFDLGIVVVRAKIEVDPLTAALTVTTDPSGEHSIPTMLDGIPLQIQHVNVTIDRPGFTFNPTNCEKLQVTGSLLSELGAMVALTIPFQATNCATLGFKPKLTVSTSGKPSRRNGTSLALKIAYPNGAMGTQAWFRTAKFDFPKQLPARLSTLQKACPAATFEANPAACPVASHAGTAVVRTPVLTSDLHGVVYFVSYGDLKFPEAVIVLQGDGVTVDLHAETFISEKTGVTSATLRSIPGVPFNSVEVSLPSGPYSEFTATRNPCAQKLTMPFAFTAQNGLAIHQSTRLAVTGCPKAKGKKAKRIKRVEKSKKVKVRQGS